MRKKFGAFCVAIGIILVVSSVLLAVYNHFENVNAGRATEEIVSQLRQKVSDENTQGMKVVEIDGYEYIGYLTIPSLNLEMAVMAQWDYDRLKISPCLYYGSVENDNMVIAAHNYNRHFGRLPKLKIGDAVRFTDMNGKVYKYRVGDMEMLRPSDTEAMINSDWDLSLYTCTPGGASRVTVRCEKIK